jgi:hypothetical protein
LRAIATVTDEEVIQKLKMENSLGGALDLLIKNRIGKMVLTEFKEIFRGYRAPGSINLG